MTSTRYLGSITPPPPSISVVTGGGDINTKASTWYFWLVNRCVGGFTKASTTSASGVVAVGDRIDITIPSSARTSGSDVREFYVLANTINNVSTASIIASYPGYTLDGTAQSPNDYSEVLTVLPGILSVSTDEQLELNKFITLEADLPTGVDLLNGMIRHVDEVGAYLTYNAALDDWYQLFPNTTNPNVGVTTDPVQLGCDRDIRSIAVSAKNQIITPVYGLSGSSRTVPIIIVNTGTTAILKGKPIEAQLNIGGESYLRYAVLTPRGIVDLTTGIVDTTDQPSIGGSFTGDGQGGAVIAIEKDLDAGKGFWFDIRLSFSPEDLGNQLREGALVEFYADFSPFNSKLSPDAGVFGDILGPVADHGRIVPNGPVLSPIITSRAGKVRGYVFPAQGESLGASDVIGVLANTADQNIVLTNNGIAYHAVTTPATASLRAIISTENGVGEATAFTGSYVVDATKYLTLTIAHPDTVRGDYPDIVGVQQQPAVLNAGKVRVYTRPVGGGSITYFDAVLTGGASDVVQVGQSAGTVIGSLPTVDPDFGLFTPETYVPAVSTGASVFASSTIEVAIAYLYENTMTRVTHDPLVLEAEATAQGDSSRYVRELSSSIWALFTLLDTIGFPLSTVVEAKALELEDLAANKLFFIRETEKIYYWDSTSMAAGDDVMVIEVTGIVVGRLIALPPDIVDLTYTASSTDGSITNSTGGTAATIPLADVTNAGLLSPADKAIIDATSGTNTGDQSFTISSPTQPDITLDNVADTLNLVGSGVTITQNALTNTVTFTAVTGFVDPMTTRGDIIIRNASNITARLGVGTTGQVLGTDGLDVFWTTLSGGGATNLAYTASPTNGIVTSDTGTDATITLADATNAGLISPADFTKLGGIEALADVTDTTNVTAAGALMDSEVVSLSGIKTLTVPDSTTISTFGATLVDDTSASDARITLGLGTAATQNTGTAIGNVVQLQNVGGIAGLPAVDGSLLTGLPSGFADPMTTIGDIIIRNGSNITARLGIGTSGQVLTVSSGVPTWATPSGGSFSNPVAIIYPSVFALTWSSGATMDNGAYNVFSVTVNATGTLAHSNVPAAGNEYWFRLHLTWTSGVLTFPTSWTKGMGAPSTTGGYLIEGLTIDGGTSFIIKVTYL